MTLADFIPADQPEKLQMIAEVATVLNRFSSADRGRRRRTRTTSPG